MIPKKIQKEIVPNKIPGDIQIPEKLLKRGIDLAVSEIRFSILNRKDNFGGTVKIEAVVKNVGSLNYSSGANQQVVLLYEDVPGAASRLVASRTFQNLPVNGSTIVSYSRAWRISDEFPPSYTAVIVFDPDIYIDGNTNNDDENNSNNRLTRQGSDINGLNWKK